MALSRAQLRAIKNLSQKKHRVERGQFLVEGIRLTEEAVESDFVVLETFHTSDLLQHPSGTSLLQKLREKALTVSLISPRELASITDTVQSQGIIAVVRQKTYSLDSVLNSEGSSSTLAAFDGISDPGNAGTMIRTSDWFGIDGILMGTGCVELYNPKVVRATAGGVFHLPIVANVDLPMALTQAKERGYTIYITSVDGETHFDKLTYHNKSVIVFGNEAWGVSDQVRGLADVKVLIRRYGAAESLNVSVACGVILSSLHRLFDE